MLNPGTPGRVVTSLRTTPLLSIAAVLCAAIGVSATTAAAALFSAVAVRGVPFPDAERLVRVWLANTVSGEIRGSLSIPELRDLEGHVAAFDAFLGTARSRAVGLLDSGAERLRGEGVTRDYFSTLGLRALHGRLLTAADFAADAPRVTVISARFWASRFGSDPEVVGRPLRTEAAVFTIVGVAPPGFDGTVESDIIEFWMPLPQYLPAALIDSRTGRSAWAIARLAPGVSQAAAQAQLAGHLAAWAQAHPALYRDLQLRVEPMGDNWRGGFKTGAALLLGAVVLLLVIAALNVAGLLVARTVDRRRELAMRAALGAGRATLVADLVLEALVLAAIGGAIGAIAAPSLLEAVVATSPVELPPYVRLQVDGVAIAVAIAAIVLAGLVAAMAPAWLTSRVEPGDVLRGVGRGSMGGGWEQRWGVALVGAEVALTLALLVTGSLLLRSFQSAQHLGRRLPRRRGDPAGAHLQPRRCRRCRGVAGGVRSRASGHCRLPGRGTGRPGGHDAAAVGRRSRARAICRAARDRPRGGPERGAAPGRRGPAAHARSAAGCRPAARRHRSGQRPRSR